MEIYSQIKAEAGGRVCVEDLCNPDLVSDAVLLGFGLNKIEIRRYRRAVREHRAAEAGPDEPVAVGATDEELKAAAGANLGRSGAVAATDEEIKAVAGATLGGSLGDAPADDAAARRERRRARKKRQSQTEDVESEKPARNQFEATLDDDDGGTFL